MRGSSEEESQAGIQARICASVFRMALCAPVLPCPTPCNIMDCGLQAPLPTNFPGRIPVGCQGIFHDPGVEPCVSLTSCGSRPVLYTRVTWEAWWLYKWTAEVAQPCPFRCDPMDWTSPGQNTRVGSLPFSRDLTQLQNVKTTQMSIRRWMDKQCSLFNNGIFIRLDKRRKSWHTAQTDWKLYAEKSDTKDHKFRDSTCLVQKRQAHETDSRAVAPGAGGAGGRRVCWGLGASLGRWWKPAWLQVLTAAKPRANTKAGEPCTSKLWTLDFKNGMKSGKYIWPESL